MDDHLHLDDREEPPHPPDEHGDPEPHAPLTAVSTTDMLNICMCMMMQTQQVLQKMAQDKVDEKRQQRREEEFCLEQHRAKLEMEERLELDRVEERRKAREAQERMEALRLEEARAMQDAQERLENLRVEEVRARREELRERREEEDRRTQLKAIQLPPQMSTRADLQEYLELF